MLQAALNGSLSKAEHPAVPITPGELLRDAMACVAAGAGALHLHPRNQHGHESLEPNLVNDVVTQLRTVCAVPIGVSTGAWIEPDLPRRLAHIQSWYAPDYASVNLSEDGAIDVMNALLECGIGIEAGVWTVEDARRLGASGLGNSVTRILIEPGELQVGTSSADAIALAAAIHATLDQYSIAAPRLQHGDGAVTWAVLTNAVQRGIDSRIGLEDTRHEPGGAVAAGNQALVRAASALGAS